MKWLELSWRNVWRHRRRSFLAMSIMALGTASLLTAIGFMLASFHGLRESTIRSGLGHIQISTPAGVMEPAALAAAQRALENRPGVRFTMRRGLFQGLVSNGPTTVAVLGSGVEPEQETRLSTGFAPIVLGSGLPVTDGKPAFAVILGKDLGAKLGAKPGATVTLLSNTTKGVLNAIDVQVAGWFTTGIPEVDARQVMIPLGAAQTLLNTDGVSRLVAVLDKTEETAQLAARLRTALPGLRVEMWSDLAPFYRQVVTLYRNIFLVLGAIIVVVVGLSVTNTMLMAISERTREMGTLLALGIGRTTIRGTFAMEGAVMGALGALAGLVAAAAIALAVGFADIQMPPPPGRTTPYPLVVFINGYAYLTVLLLMAAAGTVAAWLPTRQLMRLQVVEALRHT